MILASQSPRRLEILADAGFSPVVEPAEIDERRHAGESPETLVRRLAEEKARHVASLHKESPQETVLAADTVVWLSSGEVLGKPKDASDAARMLHLLSGATHFVSTGASAILGTAQRSLVDTAEVTFYPLTDAEISSYIASGEPADKAGAYGIQGRGRLLVQKISGDFYTVMGLPITRVVRELLEPFGAEDLVASLLGGSDGN